MAQGWLQLKGGDNCDFESHFKIITTFYGTVQYPSRYIHTLNIGVLNMTRGVRPKGPEQSHVLYTKYSTVTPHHL